MTKPGTKGFHGLGIKGRHSREPDSNVGCVEDEGCQVSHRDDIADFFFAKSGLMKVWHKIPHDLELINPVFYGPVFGNATKWILRILLLLSLFPLDFSFL